MACIFNQQNLEKVKEIEKRAYPEFMLRYDSIDSVDDAKEELESECGGGQYFCHVDNDWYILGCNRANEIEVEDLASVKSLGFAELNIILNLLRSFGPKNIRADCRSGTSYRLLKLAEKRGSIEIFSEEPWNWGNEKMYELVFKIKPTKFKEWLDLVEALDAETETRLQRINPRIFPDRDQLNKLIQQMKDEPELVTPKDAFDRVTKFTQQRSKSDPALEKANKMKEPTGVLLDLQNKYSHKQISTPELLSLTYLSSKGTDDNRISELAREIMQLDSDIRKKILFINVPQLITPNGTTDLPDLTSFAGAIHSLGGMTPDQMSKQEYFDPKTDVRPDRQKDLLIAKNGIYIYRGGNPLNCRLYGKGSTWCIASSSSTSWYFTYRHDHKQTQYFIFDTNKDEKDPARIVNPGVAPEGEYSEWVDLRNASQKDEKNNGFGINGYSSIDDYKQYLAKTLGTSIEQLDGMLKPLPIEPEEEKLMKYIKDYRSAS
jgi:hypothetical protein